MTPHISLGVPQILLVDDSEDTCELMSMALAGEGFTTAIAHSGAQALTYLKRQTAPLCMLIDYDMPDMDGLAVCEAVRGRYGDDIVVIAITDSFDVNDLRVNALFALADHHFFKPVDWKRLMIVLSALKD